MCNLHSMSVYVICNRCLFICLYNTVPSGCLVNIFTIEPLDILDISYINIIIWSFLLIESTDAMRKSIYHHLLGAQVLTLCVCVGGCVGVYCSFIRQTKRFPTFQNCLKLILSAAIFLHDELLHTHAQARFYMEHTIICHVAFLEFKLVSILRIVVGFPFYFVLTEVEVVS